jgi:hypothetical protein
MSSGFGANQLSGRSFLTLAFVPTPSDSHPKE